MLEFGDSSLRLYQFTLEACHVLQLLTRIIELLLSSRSGLVFGLQSNNARILFGTALA